MVTETNSYKLNVEVSFAIDRVTEIIPAPEFQVIRGLVAIPQAQRDIVPELVADSCSRLAGKYRISRGDRRHEAGRQQ